MFNRSSARALRASSALRSFARARITFVRAARLTHQSSPDTCSESRQSTPSKAWALGDFLSPLEDINSINGDADVSDTRY